MQPLCLIVSGDDAASADWGRGVSPYGFRPHAVPHVAAALGILAQCRFDALLVDGDGERGTEPMLGALPALRDRAAAPIVLVWSDAGEPRQLAALQHGATDTVVKPASARLIGAKLRRLVELANDRGAAAAANDADGEPDVVAHGPLRLDVRRVAAACAGRPLDFTLGEFELVRFLASRPGEVVDRDALARVLAPVGSGGARRGVDMHVCRIRKKLAAIDGAGVRLATVHGRGYALRLEAEAA